MFLVFYRFIPSRFAFVNHPDQPNIAQLTSIVDWLHSLQLDRLIQFFRKNAYTNLSQICHFDSSDFHALLGNHTTPIEQSRLIESLNHIRSELVLICSKSLLTSEGYLV